MMNAAIIVIVCGLTVAHSATLKYEVNGLESKNDQKNFDIQSTISSIMESTTGVHPETFAPLRIKTGKEEKSIMNEKKMSPRPFHPQEDQSPAFLHSSGLKTEQNMFQSGHPVAPSGFDNFNGQPIFPGRDQFYSGDKNQEQFGNRKSGYEQQSFYGDDQSTPRQYIDNQNIPRQYMDNQNIPRQYMDNQNTPRQYIDNQNTPRQYIDNQNTPRQYMDNQDMQQQGPNVYGSSQEEIEQREFFGNQQISPDQQILFNGAQTQKSQEKVFQQQPSGEQQHFYSSGMQVGNHGGIQSESHLKSQVYADKQSFSVQTQGLSAFDTRKQPLMLPGRSLHSSSMIVSGLNHLPLLPALVYNSSPVPSSHAVAIAKGAAVRQHMQTPYVRYVYSHLL